MWKKINGYKTAIGLVGAGVVMALNQLGVMSEQMFGLAMTAVATWTGVALNHKANKAINGGK